MARTTFSGPVKSDNGFEGNITGNVAGTASAVNGAVTLQGFTVATLPTVVVNGIIVVTDANTGAGTVCFGKGTSWIDISTGAAVVA
jgi:sulfite exporter TauE/SafE